MEKITPPTEENVDIDKWTSKIGSPEQQQKYVEEGFGKKMKKYASKIPFAKEAVAMYFCAMDPRTPLKAKVTAIGALAYIILPVDLIPDVIIALGFTDDAAAFWVAYNSISHYVTDEHRMKAEKWFKDQL